MPIRNMWSLEPDECIVAEGVLRRVKSAEVYFPVHDVGVDLLVAVREKHAGLQVKGPGIMKRMREVRFLVGTGTVGTK